MRKSTRVNATKREDILLIYKYFKSCMCPTGAKYFQIIVRCFQITPQNNTINYKRKDCNDNDSPHENIDQGLDSVDSFDTDVIRRVVHDFYSKKELPTLIKIRNRLEQEHDIVIKMYQLRLELIKMGFKWKRVSENKKIVIEQPDVVKARSEYLRAIQFFRKQGYQIVYLDETCVKKIHAQHIHGFLSKIVTLRLVQWRIKT